ncbi:hypothetical protein ACQP1P_16415 [Dactylosporangium sp. CA-052675]|uniref:hypothetical protein n=1 Tax=Dactylosporangium sp. CA-052675 TaxID=3239927 RepID=UPI003D8DB3E9
MRARTVALLLAGRGAGRLAQYGAGFALLAVWGPDRFAGYAAAVGVGLWAFALAATGVERSALVTLAPVAAGDPVPAERRALEGMFAALGLLPFALALAACAAAGLVEPGGPAVRYAAGIAFMTGTGALAVLVALLRLRGRPGADPAAYAVLSVAYGAAVALAALAGLGVGGVLAFLVAVTAAVVAVLLLVLRPTGPGPGRRFGRAAVVAALRTAGLFAAGDVLGNAAVSVLYAELAALAPAEQGSLLYVGLTVSVALGALSNYVLRLWQPAILVWLAAGPASAPVRLRRGLVLAGAAGLVVTVAAGLAGNVIVALAVEIVTFLAVSGAAFVIESIDDRARLNSALSALAGLGVVALAGLLLIPSGGAAGALVAMAAGWLARVPWLFTAARPRTPAPRAGIGSAPGEPSRPA